MIGKVLKLLAIAAAVLLLAGATAGAVTYLGELRAVWMFVHSVQPQAFGNR